MKKTLIALMALAAVASAASVDYTSYESLGLDSDLFAAFDFSKGTANVGGDGISGSFTVEDGVAVLGDGKGEPWSDSITVGAATGGDFTISMDLLNLGSSDDWGCLFIGYSSTSTGSGYNNSLTLQVNANKELTWSTSNGGEDSYAGNAAYNFGTGIFTSDINGKTHADGQTLTLVQDSTTKTLTLYVDGEQIAQATDWNSAAMKAINFGCIFGGWKKIGSAEIDNLAMWNTALSADQVKSLVVPEPTTATLSLLALAGLAARRRRR